MVNHLLHMRLILDVLTTNHFVAKLSKCVFAFDIVDYVGHVISAKGVAPDLDKIAAITD